MNNEDKIYDVLIVGAGISGIGAACHIQKKSPSTTYIICEARSSLGGTWDLFTYPGVRSDSDMYTLGYSFKPWTGKKAIADGPSILNYLKETAKEFGVEESINYETKVIQSDWSSTGKYWTVTAIKNNKDIKYKCRYVHVCSGYYDYDEGYTPNFNKIENYKGLFVHPQKWNNNIDYSNKNVVIIGSGATAVTLLPEIGKKAKLATMLQRSPTYMVTVPEVDTWYKLSESFLPKKITYPIIRWKNICQRLAFYFFCRFFPEKARKKLLMGSLNNLDNKEDIKHFKPAYKPWDQRLCAVPNSDLFKSLNERKSQVVTGHIEEFTENGILLKNGDHLDADIIISATGLKVKFLSNINVSIDGKRKKLQDCTAYKSIMLSGVPNFSMVFGYTNSSWTLKADLVNAWVARVVDHMKKNNHKTVTPDSNPDVEKSPYVDLASGYIQRAMGAFPMKGDRNPWSVNQNYFKDIYLLRFKKITDKGLNFQ
jgi:monooxygenase